MNWLNAIDTDNEENTSEGTGLLLAPINQQPVNEPVFPVVTPQSSPKSPEHHEPGEVESIMQELQSWKNDLPGQEEITHDEPETLNFSQDDIAEDENSEPDDLTYDEPETFSGDSDYERFTHKIPDEFSQNELDFQDFSQDFHNEPETSEFVLNIDNEDDPDEINELDDEASEISHELHDLQEAYCPKFSQANGAGGVGMQAERSDTSTLGGEEVTASDEAVPRLATSGIDAVVAVHEVIKNGIVAVEARQSLLEVACAILGVRAIPEGVVDEDATVGKTAQQLVDDALHVLAIGGVAHGGALGGRGGAIISAEHDGEIEVSAAIGHECLGRLHGTVEVGTARQIAVGGDTRVPAVEDTRVSARGIGHELAADDGRCLVGRVGKRSAIGDAVADEHEIDGFFCYGVGRGGDGDEQAGHQDKREGMSRFFHDEWHEGLWKTVNNSEFPLDYLFRLSD